LGVQPYIDSTKVCTRKGKRHNTYIAPLAATAASIALFVTG